MRRAGSRSGFPRFPLVRARSDAFSASAAPRALQGRAGDASVGRASSIYANARASVFPFHPQSRVGRRGVKASLEKKETRSERVTIEKESESIGIAPKICGEQVCVLKISLLWPLGPGPK